MTPDKKPPTALTSPSSANGDGPGKAQGKNPVKASARSAPPDLVRPSVDVIDGIPGRRANTAAWKYILLAIIFLAWIAFLIYIRSGGAE